MLQVISPDVSAVLLDVKNCAPGHAIITENSITVPMPTTRRERIDNHFFWLKVFYAIMDHHVVEARSCRFWHDAICKPPAFWERLKKVVASLGRNPQEQVEPSKIVREARGIELFYTDRRALKVGIISFCVGKNEYRRLLSQGLLAHPVEISQLYMIRLGASQVLELQF